jgi:hypothetical protein
MVRTILTHAELRSRRNGKQTAYQPTGAKTTAMALHDYVAVAVSLLFVTAVLFSFRINDWVNAHIRVERLSRFGGARTAGAAPFH